MEVRHRRSCWPPRRVETRLAGPFDAIEVGAPGRGRIESRRQTFHRQRQLCYPSFVLLVDFDPAPQSALQIAFYSRPNLQVDPESVWAHFELFIVPFARPWRLQKNFSDIVLPKLVAPSIRFGIGENGDATIKRQESQIKSIESPQQAHLGLSLWIGVLALPVAVKTYRRGVAPCGKRRKSFRIDPTGKL